MSIFLQWHMLNGIQTFSLEMSFGLSRKEIEHMNIQVAFNFYFFLKNSRANELQHFTQNWILG